MSSDSIDRSRDAASGSVELPSPSRPAWPEVLRHELKTPLTGIAGMADLLRRSVPSPEQRAVCDALLSSAEQLGALIERLVPAEAAGEAYVVGESDAGGRRNESGVWLDRFLEALILAHWPRARSEGLGLYGVVEPDAPHRWWGPSAGLREVLDNLIANALEATRDGHVLLHAARGTEPSGNPVLVVSVKDTGPGLDQPERPYTWGWRGGSGGTSGGRGIGLSVCRELARTMGAKLVHEPRPNGGTVFRLKLPLAGDSIRPPIPGAIRHLRCAVALPEPTATVMLKMLERIGAAPVRASGPHGDAVDAPVIVCCQPDPGVPVARPGAPAAGTGCLIACRNPDGSGWTTRALPQPLLRTGVEAALLEAVVRAGPVSGAARD